MLKLTYINGRVYHWGTNDLATAKVFHSFDQALNWLKVNNMKAKIFNGSFRANRFKVK